VPNEKPIAASPDDSSADSGHIAGSDANARILSGLERPRFAPRRYPGVSAMAARFSQALVPLEAVDEMSGRDGPERMRKSS
jgi:hypothetical protein